MDARVVRGKHPFYDPVPGKASQLGGMGNKSLDWDINDWRWDSNLFLASPLNPTTSDCRSKQLFPGPTAEGPSTSLSSCREVSYYGLLAKRNTELEELDDRQRPAGGQDVQLLDASEPPLLLNLGDHAYPVVTDTDHANLCEKSSKRLKSQGNIAASGPTCQVVGCGVDLSGCKDYHRRHKVCEMHAKATNALVGNVTQRFCQQCSRFHLLQEFDDGKRSCRRRLAGHNRRRRKTHPEVPASASLIDNQSSTYMLISLLRIISNLNSDRPNLAKDQEFLSQLLRSLVNLAGSCDVTKLAGLLREPQDLQKDQRCFETATGGAEFVGGVHIGDPSQLLHLTSKAVCTAVVGDTSQGMPGYTKPISLTTVDTFPSAIVTENILPGSMQEPPITSPSLLPQADAYLSNTEGSYSKGHGRLAKHAVERAGLRDFDLNDAYVDRPNCDDDGRKLPASSFLEPSLGLSEFHQSSPPQTSRNSDSASLQSLSSSSGDAQSRTGKIVFKLFGKDPNSFPLLLRSQILDWLSHSPSDMESYIRPGCIILTIYLRLAAAAWTELSHDLSSSMLRLLHASDDGFWRRGWIYAILQQHATFIFNGKVMLQTPLLHGPKHHRILGIVPIAVPLSSDVCFTVNGFKLAQSSTRILCAYDGKYLFQETTQALLQSSVSGTECKKLQCLSFSCSMPNASGRGFIEVEDNCLDSDFFPFIVAEEDLCSEIRTLENSIISISNELSAEVIETTHVRNQALEFLDEMGWLLQRSHWRLIKEARTNLNDFSPARFRWILSYSMEREWLAVVKKLLDILFEGTIDVCGSTAVDFINSEHLLHSAVRRNSKPLVEFLLRYKPHIGTKELGPDSFLFRPDLSGPSEITPLHIAASNFGSESILDALTNDPGQLGIKAWNTVCDSTGFTPENYARSCGYISYINFIQKKIDKQRSYGHVVDVPGSLVTSGSSKFPYNSISSKLVGFEINKNNSLIHHSSCKICDQKLVYGSYARRSLFWRPLLIPLLVTAAICVTVGLLFRGAIKLVCLPHPYFIWEAVEFGAQ